MTEPLLQDSSTWGSLPPRSWCTGLQTGQRGRLRRRHLAAVPGEPHHMALHGAKGEMLVASFRAKFGK